MNNKFLPDKFFLNLFEESPSNFVLRFDNRLDNSDLLEKCKTCRLFYPKVTNRNHQNDCRISAEKMLRELDSPTALDLVTELWNQKISKIVKRERTPKSVKDTRTITNLKRVIEAKTGKTEKGLKKRLKFLETLG